MLFVHYKLERVTMTPMSWPYMTMRNPIGTCRQNISTLQVTSKNIIFDLYTEHSRGEVDAYSQECTTPKYVIFG